MFGITANLRHYAFGELQNQTNWSLDLSKLSQNNCLYRQNALENNSIDWYHQKYKSLDEMKNTITYTQLINTV